MSSIKITKKNGTSHVVPASQRSTYEAFNEKATKLKKPNDVVKIEDYEEPAEDSAKGSKAPAGKTAKEVIELINAATTVEEVDAALPEGEARVSVIAAADAKKASF